MSLSVSASSLPTLSQPATKATTDSGASSGALSRKDLIASLNQAVPGLSVAFGRLPSDEKEQEKRARAGDLAAITIEPKAAERMQSDATYRDDMIALIKQDHEEWGPGTIHDMGGSKSEVIAHGISINDDGSTSSWTFSKTVSDDESFLDKLKDKLKAQQEKGKLSQERYEAAMKEAEQMKAAGKSDEEVAAKLRDAYLATMTGGDSPSVGVATVA